MRPQPDPTRPSEEEAALIPSPPPSAHRLDLRPAAGPSGPASPASGLAAGRARSRRAAGLAAALLLALLAALPAAAWDVRPDAPEESFRLFHERFAGAAYHFPKHSASPLGLIGFEVFADLAADRDFDEEGFYPDVVAGDLPGGTLAIARVGVRKGLPGGVDLGLAYGQALDGEMELVSGDVQWAFVDGGAVTPALALRLTGTQNLDSGPYQLEQYGAELMVSKGFAILTPYAGAGFVWDEGTLERTDGSEVSVDDEHYVLYGGLVLNLLLPKIVVEVEKAEHLQAAVKVGFGF